MLSLAVGGPPTLPVRSVSADPVAQGNEAFYNKAQVQNRDLSLAVLREYFALRCAAYQAPCFSPSFNWTLPRASSAWLNRRCVRR